MWNDGTICQGPRSTGFDVVYLADWYVEGINHLAPYVWQTGFLAEKIANRRDAVLQWNAVDSDAPVFIDKRMKAGIYGMEDDFVPDIRVIGSLEEVEQFSYLPGPMNVQLGCSPKQVHCSDKSGQSEHVVTMVVADEDMPDVRHRKSHYLHFSLCSFAAVYHEILASHIENLRGWLVACGGLGRTTTKYVQFKVQSDVPIVWLSRWARA